MTVLGGGGERHSGRCAPLENAGILRCAQNDDVKRATATAKASTTATAKARAKRQRQEQKGKGKSKKAKARAKRQRQLQEQKTKYRDLSTAAAKCAAFGRDDVCYGELKREQATARTTARTRAGWETVYIPTLGA